jgi:hypothetical protein
MLRQQPYRTRANALYRQNLACLRPCLAKPLHRLARFVARRTLLTDRTTADRHSTGVVHQIAGVGSRSKASINRTLVVWRI